MVVKRDSYLRRLIAGRHNGLVKIVTGIRRSGKSFLLLELFRRHLAGEGVDDAHVIAVALDDRRAAALRDPDRMLEYIDGRVADDRMHYVILDEVQMMDAFADVLNSLLHRKNVDVYVTGSNSRFLSSDVATEFRGRGDEIHLYPLSFAEFYSAFGGGRQERWKEYCAYGGLPQLLTLEGGRRKEEFLIYLMESVYLKDIAERHRVKNRPEFRELLRVIASGIGSPCSPRKLCNTFRSAGGAPLDRKTVSAYLAHMEESFLVERAVRFDIKGKRYIGSLSKYYFQDIGLRNALLSFRQTEENHIMENVVYNELRARGFRVDTGSVEIREANRRRRAEVDFVANSGSLRYYVQSAFAMPAAAKKEQESASLKNIKDSFKRVIVVKDDTMPHYDENGFFIIGLFDFLLNPDSLEAV